MLPLFELEKLKHKTYAKNTNRKSRWGVTAYNERRTETINNIGAEFVDTSILKSDLTKPKELVTKQFLYILM